MWSRSVSRETLVHALRLWNGRGDSGQKNLLSNRSLLLIGILRLAPKPLTEVRIPSQPCDYVSMRSLALDLC